MTHASFVRAIRPAVLIATLLGLGACATHTNKVYNVVKPTKLSAVCVERPVSEKRIAILVTEQTPGDVTERTKAQAEQKVREAIALYERSFETRMIKALQAQGVNAISCSSSSRDARDRISAYITQGGMFRSALGGNKTWIRVSVALRLWSMQQPAWIAVFGTGNAIPSYIALDEENVDSFAEEIIHQLRVSGWLS